jgi:PPOX class probable FMN-dependent enzyme
MYQPKVTVKTAAEVKAILGEDFPSQVAKILDHIDVHCRAWIERCPFVVISSTNAAGAMDVSPKGDPPGFVHVIDDTTIAIPERPGNKRVDGYLNVLQRPYVGALFLIPGRGDTLRINGSARILADADYFDAMAVKGKRPILALEIDVEEVFFHCAKAFLRSDTWDPSTWDPTAVPSVAQLAKAIKKDMSMEELEKYYSEGNLRSILY